MDQKYSSSLSSACSSSKKGSSNNRANLTSHNASTKKSSTKKSKKSSDANNKNISSQTTKSSKSIFDTHNKTFREPLLHDTTIDSDYNNNENNVSTLDKTMQTRIFDPCCDGDAACSRDDVDQRSEEGLKIDQNNNFTASLENHNNNNQRTSVQIDNQSNLVSGCQDDILLIDEIRR